MPVDKTTPEQEASYAAEREAQAVAKLPPGPSLALPPMTATESVPQWITRLMEMLPPPADDVADKIAAAILTAESPIEENMLWEGATSSKNLMGERFIFHSCHIQPSDQEDSRLPYYLICDVTNCGTGERGVMSTGSYNIVAALVKAQVLGQLPWEAEIVGPRRRKENKLPLHLRWIAKIVDSDQDGAGSGD